MKKSEALIESITAEKILPLFRKQPMETVLKVTEYLEDAGFHHVEITMETENVESIIRETKRRFPNVQVGAGTVKTVEDAKRAIDAGASFIVTPNIREDVISYVAVNDTPIISGAFTPSEIFNAYSMGSKMVKVFPAGNLGPSFFKNVSGPMEEVPLIATGGITLDNVQDYLRAGVKAVGVGSALFPKEAVEAGNWEVVREAILAWKRKVE